MRGFWQLRAKSHAQLQSQPCRTANVAVLYASLCKADAEDENQERIWLQCSTQRATRQVVLCGVPTGFFENLILCEVFGNCAQNPTPNFSRSHAVQQMWPYHMPLCAKQTPHMKIRSDFGCNFRRSARHASSFCVACRQGSLKT